MHSSREFTAQVGQDMLARPPMLQQYRGAVSVTTTPPPHPSFHHGSLDSQHVNRPEHHTFPLRPGGPSFLHTPSGASHQNLPGPVVSTGLNSSQLYSTHPPAPPPHGSTHSSNPYPTFDPQYFSWSKNVHQISSTAPLLAPRPYMLTSSQGHSMERGPPPQVLSQRVPPSLLPPPPTLPISSFTITNTTVSAPHMTLQQPHLHSAGSQPQFPLHPPPPLPPSPPPGAPPLAPSSPPKLSDNYERSSSKSLPLEDNLISTIHTPQDNTPRDGGARAVEVRSQSTEVNGVVVEQIDASCSHSPTNSDMDMDDDISEPIEEKSSCPRENLDKENVCLPQNVANVLPDSSLNTEGYRPFKLILDGSSLNAGSSASHVQKLGSKIQAPFAEASEEFSDHLIEGESPFKFLQSYASDDSSENDDKTTLRDAGHQSIFGSTNVDAKEECYSVTDIESNELFPLKSTVKSLAPEEVDEVGDKSQGDQEPMGASTCPRSLLIDSSRSSDSAINHQEEPSQKPNTKSNNITMNVDEFGRLVREGGSDSDTSDSIYYRHRHSRRGRRQSRSKSRSHSPHGRMKSSYRRNERKRISLSPSPQRRRSRIKSPISRRGSEFVLDRPRRGKGQFPECFDYQQGKCYRGASCRYAHHESYHSERSRYNRGKEKYMDKSPTYRSPEFHAERISEKKSIHKKKEVKDWGQKLPQELPVLNEGKDADESPINPVAQKSEKLRHSPSAATSVVDSLSNNIPSSVDVALENENSAIQESSAQILFKNNQLFGKQNEYGDSLICESLPVQASATAPTNLSVNKPGSEDNPFRNLCTVGNPKLELNSADKFPSHSLNSNDLFPHTAEHSYQFTVPSPVYQGTSSQFGQGISQDYSLRFPTVPFPLKTENFSPFRAPIQQHSLIPEFSSDSLSVLSRPPMKPPITSVSVNVSVGNDHSVLPKQHAPQYLQPPNSSIMSLTTRPYFSDLSTQSQIGQYQAYQSPMDLRICQSDNTRSNTLDASNLTRNEDDIHILANNLGQRRTPSISNFQPQPISYPMQSLPMGIDGVHTGSLPSNNNPSHGRPYLQPDYYSLKYPSHVVSAQLGDPGYASLTTSRVASDFLERNHRSSMPDSVGSGISDHYSIYGSTVGHPPSSQFSSNALISDKDTSSNSKFGPTLGLSSNLAHGIKAGNFSLTNIISTHAVEGVQPRVVSEQYDPLLDSIEPAPSSFIKVDYKKHDSPDDFFKNQRLEKEGGVVLSADSSLAIEEYGETADAEVGAVVSGSPINPHRTIETNTGEIEIDQVEKHVKGKKGKDSRSMKLFKLSITTFVKEVLKPSWRQGNMSKEAFKTIVKKTVDKVSNAMKSHKIPKSQAKINHYIDSSRGKLTRLVMGYVNKYAKA